MDHYSMLFAKKVDMKRIVVIDSDKELLKSIKFFLLKRGFRVSIFTDWLKAMKNIRKYQPQLIILEVFLENFDGLEACNKIKANPFTRHIPVLIFSGFSKVADAAIYEYGANDFISKPFSINDFIEKIYNILPNTVTNIKSLSAQNPKRSLSSFIKKAFRYKIVSLPAFVLMDTIGFIIKKLSPNTSSRNSYSL